MHAMDYYYKASANDFIIEAKIEHGEFLAEILALMHKDRFRKDADDALYNSWKYSLPALAEVLSHGHATKERIVVLECCLRNRGRVDALLCGRKKPYTREQPVEYPSVCLIELKQWGGIEYRASPLPDSIEAKWGGVWHTRKHPSLQVLEYREALMELLKDHRREKVLVHQHAYMHNTHWQKGEEHDLFRGKKFSEAISKAPLYTYRARRAFGECLRANTHRGGGENTWSVLKDL